MSFSLFLSDRSEGGVCRSTQYNADRVHWCRGRGLPAHYHIDPAAEGKNQSDHLTPDVIIHLSKSQANLFICVCV